MSIKSKFFTKWGENALKINDMELALKMVNKAINADPQDLKAHFIKVNILGLTGQPEEALKTLDQAIETNPENEKEINELGLRQALVEEIDYIKTGKNVAVEYYNEGIILLNQTQELEESIKMFDKALEIDPQFAKAYYNKGVVLKMLERHEEALKMFDKASEINPELIK